MRAGRRGSLAAASWFNRKLHGCRGHRGWVARGAGLIIADRASSLRAKRSNPDNDAHVLDCFGTMFLAMTAIRACF
ncbi:MAG: hypothetical protein LBH18_05780 [Spirochaetaceae bacterium]|nr:hypothetical protein [Spirochaetaceae bacterium]